MSRRVVKPKDLKPLIPPDPKQCQAEISNGVNAFTCGGVRKMIRCTATPIFIVTETKPGKDGRKGSMSVCASCLVVLSRQVKPGFFTMEMV